MKSSMETERLILRRFQPEDWQDLHEYLSDEQVVKFEPYRPFTEEQSREEAERRAGDRCFLAVCLRETGKLIGNLYFAAQQPDEFMIWEIGYVFSRMYQGKGYATEAVNRLMEHIFEDLNAHRVEANCNPQNTPSWRLLERLHLRREGHFLQKVFFFTDDEGEPLWHDAYAYGMLRNEWLAIQNGKKHR